MAQDSDKLAGKPRLEAAGWITSSVTKQRRMSQGMEPPTVGMSYHLN